MLPLAAAASTATVVMIVPLILTYMFLESSNRPVIWYAEAAHGSLHPASLLTAVIGDLYGALDPHVEYWGPYSIAWNPRELALSQNMSQLYIGALPILALLTIGLFRGQAWVTEIRYFSIALGVMLVYGLGAFTPIYHLFYNYIPGVAFFRRPADATFMIGGMTSIVGGYCVHRLAVGTVPRVSRPMFAVEAGVVALILMLGLGIAGWLGHASVAIKPLLVASACLSLSGVAARSIQHYAPRYALLCLIGVAVLTTVDLGVNNGPNQSTALPVSQYDILKPNCRNETIKFLKLKLKQPPGSARRDRVELVGLGFEWPNVALVHGFDHVLGYNPVRLDVVARAIGARETIAGWDQRVFTPLFPSYRSLLADMLGLRFIATAIPIERIDKHLKNGELPLIYRTKDAYIYENTQALPRVMFVSNWKLADFDALIETGAWPEFDPSATVLLQNEPTLAAAEASTDQRSESSATIASYKNTMVDVDVMANQPGFVLLNDVWHPWWRATVDGNPVDILKANVMFRAIAVAAGKHRVHFDFEPILGAIAEIEHPTSMTNLASHKLRARRPGA